MTRFWRAVAKFAAKRAGLQVIKDVPIGSTVIWPANAHNVRASWSVGRTHEGDPGQTSSNSGVR